MTEELQDAYRELKKYEIAADNEHRATASSMRARCSPSSTTSRSAAHVRKA